MQHTMRALVKTAPGVGNVAIREVPVREPKRDESSKHRGVTARGGPSIRMH